MCVCVCHAALLDNCPIRIVGLIKRCETLFQSPLPGTDGNFPQIILLSSLLGQHAHPSPTIHTYTHAHAHTHKCTQKRDIITCSKRSTLWISQFESHLAYPDSFSARECWMVRGCSGGTRRNSGHLFDFPPESGQQSIVKAVALRKQQQAVYGAPQTAWIRPFTRAIALV